MNFYNSPNVRLLFFFLLLVSLACSPVWLVENFINLDGSAHLYSGYLMSELLKGNPQISEIYAFNSFSIPNASGHWGLAFLLNIFPPGLVTKISVTLLFALFVASIGWFRLKTVGAENLETSLLIAAAIGLNWFWLMGFYNFLIGVIGLVFTLGLFYGWREELNWKRSGVMAVLFLVVYFSHIISLGMLAGSVFLLFLYVPFQNFKKGLIWIILPLLPILPLFYLYKSLSNNDGGFSPSWRNPDAFYSPVGWFNLLRTADPLQIISERTFPFFNYYSEYFRLFSPILWLFIAFLILAGVTLFTIKKDELLSPKYLPFLLLFGFSILLTMLSPDSLGFTHGSYLRERVLLFSFIFFVPLFRLGKSVWLKNSAHFCLAFIILFQTLSLWDYALQTNQEAKEFLAASDALEEKNDTLASVIIMDESPRFYARPTAQMTAFLGIKKNIIVWDDYEIGHYLFPVIAKNRSDKEFILSYTNSNSFFLTGSTKSFDETLSSFDANLQAHHNNISALLVWGKDDRIQAIINKWYEPVPNFANGRVRVFRLKKS